jgi:hypothetical protein
MQFQPLIAPDVHEVDSSFSIAGFQTGSLSVCRMARFRREPKKQVPKIAEFKLDPDDKMNLGRDLSSD